MQLPKDANQIIGTKFKSRIIATKDPIMVAALATAFWLLSKCSLRLWELYRRDLKQTQPALYNNTRNVSI